VIKLKEWKEKLEFFKSLEYEYILKFIHTERNNGKSILPRDDEIFNALKYTRYDELKVVILGQDPYPNIEHAHGLCFSIPSECNSIPKSLLNIMKELKNDLNIELSSGNLTSWARQGVLLLNTVLTVEEGMSNSHKKIGWKSLTNEIIELINKEKEDIVFILWGKHAQNLCKNVDDSRHYLISSVHPSPLSSYRGFFDSKPFSKTNKFLKDHNSNEIDWSN